MIIQSKKIKDQSLQIILGNKSLHCPSVSSAHHFLFIGTPYIYAWSAGKKDSYTLMLQYQKRSEASQKNPEVSQKNSEVSQKSSEVSQKSSEVSQKSPEASQKSSEASQKSTEVPQYSSEIVRFKLKIMN